MVGSYLEDGLYLKEPLLHPLYTAQTALLYQIILYGIGHGLHLWALHQVGWQLREKVPQRLQQAQPVAAVRDIEPGSETGR